MTARYEPKPDWLKVAPRTGDEYFRLRRLVRERILEKGGSRDAMELYVDFRGREPTTDALLRHSGIAA